MNLPKSNTQYIQKGFTLIELLIVIVIIGILAGIMLMVVDFSEYLAQGRDSQRIALMLQIQTSITGAVSRDQIELTDTSSCVDCDSITGTYGVSGTGYIKFNNIDRGLKDYIQVLPKDPKNEGDLKFSYYSDGEYFELNTVLESEKFAPNQQDDGGNDPDVYERGWELTLH